MLSANSIDIIVCCILIFASIVGNTVLIYCTWRCIARRLPTSFAVIFSLAIAHLVKNLVINTITIVSSAGISTNSVACKIGMFTGSVTTVLEIWFTLYLAIFYCIKLNRIVHPEGSPPNGKWRTPHLICLFALWIIAFAFCCPYLIFGESMERTESVNTSDLFNHSILNEECIILFYDDNVLFFYEQIFMVIIELLPLVILVMVSFCIIFLFLEQKKSAYRNIWIGHDTSVTEVLRASILMVLLTYLVTSLWVSHFIVTYFQKNGNSCFSNRSVLSVLFSGYSSVSPHLLILINYKFSFEMRSVSFCSKNVETNKLSDSPKVQLECTIVEN